MNIKLKYKIGQIIKAKERVYKVIGFEYCRKKVRYILMTGKELDTINVYLYEDEIKFIS